MKEIIRFITWSCRKCNFR